MSELTETKAKIYEALTKRKDGQIDWLFKEIDALKSQLAERDRTVKDQADKIIELIQARIQETARHEWTLSDLELAVTALEFARNRLRSLVGFEPFGGLEPTPASDGIKRIEEALAKLKKSEG